MRYCARMFSRILSVAIVIFWLTMTTLLVRMELSPRDSRLKAVPVEHVMKLLFLHEQSLDLNIALDGQRVGYLRLHPRQETGAQMRLLDFVGNLQVRLPQAPKQRFSWSGMLEMNHDFELQSASLGFTMHEPEAYRVDLQIDAPHRTVQVLWKAGDRVLEEETFTLDEFGAQKAMKHFGIDPNIVRAASGNSGAKPLITAQQSSLRIRGESTETYLVLVRQNGQTLCEIQVSQIGQILDVKTFLGYRLAPEDLMP